MDMSRRLPRPGLLLAASAFLTLAVWLALAGSAQGAPNSVRIQPATVTVGPGGSVTVSLAAEAPPAGLAAWQINVMYNNSLLTATACSAHPLGGCNKDSSPDTVQSSGDLAQDNLTGQHVLAEITFQATGPAGACSPLDVHVARFIDADDIETNPTANGGKICVQSSPPPTNLPTPGPTPAPTAEPPPCDRISEFDPENFSHPTNIDNPWLPLTPGRKLVLQGVADGLPHRVVFITTDLTKVINGVRTVGLWGRDYAGEEPQEAELAFFAQDDTGNVWSFGRYPEEFQNGEFVGAPDTWIAGKAKAEGGVHVPADPQAGEFTYLQGWAPEIGFLDCAQVIETDVAVCVPIQCYDHVLITEEGNPLDLGSGQVRKYHSLGVGVVQVSAVEDPKGETIALTKDEQLSAVDMEWARLEALKLEERAYAISEVYADTPPAELAPETAAPTPTPAQMPTLTPDPTPIPRSLAAVLAAIEATNGSSRARSLPSSGGGSPISGASSISWLIPLGMGLALLASYGRSYLRWVAAKDRVRAGLPQANRSRQSESEMPWVREALELEKRAYRLREMYRDASSRDRRRSR